MLYLKPPYHIFEGVVVYADHANDRQFYYMPGVPKLSTGIDASGRELPFIQLLKYRGDTLQGGFLNLEVNLGIEQEKIDKIAIKLRAIYQLDDTPLMSPILIESGEVKLIALGAESPDPDPDDGAPPDDEPLSRFVEEINQAASPALYGDNKAIFSIELTRVGVELIEASISMKDNRLPVGVIYSLDYFALRPAFTVKVSVDWDRVQTHFEESFGVSSLFYEQDVSTVVDSLIESRVIQIDVDSFLPEGEDAGSWVGRRDQAIIELKDMVLENFFEPSLDPMSEEEDTWDKITSTVQSLYNISVLTFKYTKKDFTRIDKKSINLSMNERITVRKKIYPQAFLRGMHYLLTDESFDRSLLIQKVTLDSNWFQKRRVNAHALVNFERDSVEAILVTLKYGDHLNTLRLTREAQADVVDWNSIISSTNTIIRDVELSYSVRFRDVNAAERPAQIDSSARIVTGSEIEISPTADNLYFVDEIIIGADLMPWSRYPSVAVEVAYTDEANNIRLMQAFLLSESKPEVTWRRFRIDPARPEYQIRVIYLSNTNRDIVHEWIVTDQERFLVRDPRPASRTLQVVPAVDWNLVSMVFVELNYRDAENSIDEYKTLSFMNTDGERSPKSFSVSLDDPEKRLISYDASILLSDNRLIQIPRSLTAASSVFLRADMVGHRIVSVSPAEADFPQRGIINVVAVLDYQDDEYGLAYEDTLTFYSQEEVAYFEFDYARAEYSDYQCSVRINYTNGLSQFRELGFLDGDVILLPVA